MTRLRALAIVALLWAAIYLPALGSFELKGEEGRRIMPAVTMLESGDWVVPRIGGVPYLRKPPLMNWAIAASMKIFGAQNEWTARLPSVLAVLALGATIVCASSGWLGAESALIAAIFAMTNAGLLEKGRLAEIESLYIAFTGGAIVCWLAWRQQERSRWLVWLVPFAMFGLAMLTKGPPCLLFFYVLAAVVLRREKKLRELVSLPHIAGLALMLAIFAAWAVPYFRAHPEAVEVWRRESAHRFGIDEDFDWKSWMLGVPRSLVNFLPWVLLVPLWWSEKCLARLSLRDADLVRALRWPVVILFFALVLLPGALPRYTLPMLAPACVLLALVLHDDAPPARRALVFWRKICVIASALFALAAVIAMSFPRVLHAPLWGALAICIALFLRRRLLQSALNLALCTALLCACGVAFFAALMPRIRERDDLRPVAGMINSIVPAGATVCAYDLRFLAVYPAYHPALFYLHPKIVYAQLPSQIPVSLFVFTRDCNAENIRAIFPNTRTLGQLEDKRGRRFVLLKTGTTSR